MATPQPSELRLSGDASLPGEPVPEDNLPGHHPEEEQDKPDPDDFVAKAKEVAARKRATTPASSASAAPAPAPAPSRSATAADAPSATKQALAAQVVAGSTDVASTPAPTQPAPHPEDGTTTNPLVRLVALQWKVATLPVRFAIGAVDRIRRLL